MVILVFFGGGFNFFFFFFFFGGGGGGGCLNPYQNSDKFYTSKSFSIGFLFIYNNKAFLLMVILGGFGGGFIFISGGWGAAV